MKEYEKLMDMVLNLKISEDMKSVILLEIGRVVKSYEERGNNHEM